MESVHIATHQGIYVAQARGKDGLAVEDDSVNQSRSAVGADSSMNESSGFGFPIKDYNELVEENRALEMRLLQAADAISEVSAERDKMAARIVELGQMDELKTQQLENGRVQWQQDREDIARLTQEAAELNGRLQRNYESDVQTRREANEINEQLLQTQRALEVEHGTTKHLNASISALEPQLKITRAKLGEHECAAATHLK